MQGNQDLFCQALYAQSSSLLLSLTLSLISLPGLTAAVISSEIFPLAFHRNVFQPLGTNSHLLSSKNELHAGTKGNVLIDSIEK